MLAQKLTLSLATVVSVLGLELFAKSDDSSVDGLGLASIHEGAGINYFLLGEQAQNLEYSDGTISSSDQGPVPYDLGAYGTFLGLGVSEALPVTFDGDNLVVNGTDTFYAAKNQNDPYSYTEKQYGVLYLPEGNIPDGAIKISIVKKDDQNSTTTTTTSSATAAPTVTTITDNGAAKVGVAGAGILAAAACLF